MNNVGTFSFLMSTVLGLFLLTGCASTPQGGKTYTRAQAQQPLTVYHGTVLRVEAVQIQSEETGAGAAIGAVAGAIVGSTIGGGDGEKLAEVGGALAGGAIGSVAESKRRTKAAWEIEVEMDNGRLVSVVQEQDDHFAVGDRIRVLESEDGTLRVRQ